MQKLSMPRRRNSVLVSQPAAAVRLHVKAVLFKDGVFAVHYLC